MEPATEVAFNLVSSNSRFPLRSGNISAGTMYGKSSIKWKVVSGQKILNLGEVVIPLVKWADQPEGKAPPLKFFHIRGLPETISWESLRGKWVSIFGRTGVDLANGR